MKKVLDKDLEARIKGIIKTSKAPAADVVAFLKEIQDASGVKVCQNVSEQDIAYMDVGKTGSGVAHKEV